MYWVVRDNGHYEVLDGQQRTPSICHYVSNAFSHNMRFFSNLQPDEKERILNYELQIYFCEETESEKLDWFRTVNIAGERLTKRQSVGMRERMILKFALIWENIRTTLMQTSFGFIFKL